MSARKTLLLLLASLTILHTRASAQNLTDPFDVMVGTWSGTYRCMLGATSPIYALDAEMTKVSSGDIRRRFVFAKQGGRGHTHTTSMLTYDPSRYSVMISGTMVPWRGSNIFLVFEAEDVQRFLAGESSTLVARAKYTEKSSKDRSTSWNYRVTFAYTSTSLSEKYELDNEGDGNFRLWQLLDLHRVSK